MRDLHPCRIDALEGEGETEREGGDMSRRKAAEQSQVVSVVRSMWYGRFSPTVKEDFFFTIPAWQPAPSESPIFPNPLEIFISLLAAVAEQRTQL